MSNFYENIILKTDSYKMSHPMQYPKNIDYMHNYIESRGGCYGYTCFFGLQYYLKKYLTQTITEQMVDEAEILMKAHQVPFYADGWRYIVRELGGKLPLRIRAAKEGSVIKNHNVLITVESTDPKTAWLVGWVETLLLKVWFPITVASFSYKLSCIIKYFLDKSSDNSDDELMFRLQDFGYRGVSSEESAAIGGAAHLVSFQGTDNLAAILCLRHYYQAEMAGFSVPAAEHSTITSWGKNNELDAFDNMLVQFPHGIVSIVADSYNYFEAVDQIIGHKLKDKILKHDGFVTIRPDSGDPIANILFALESVEKNFGVTVNSKGYKVLNKIRILQGDGINENAIWDILKAVCDQGFSAENIVLGCGGALLQGNMNSSINRDTHRFAMKCSAITKGNSEIINVFKNPITDKGKISKQGRLDLICEGNANDPFAYKTININDLGLNNYHPNSMLDLVFENGEIKREQSLEQIRSINQGFRNFIK